MAGLIGAWMLQAFSVEEVQTGVRWAPFGPAPRGTMMFHPHGRMIALMMPRERVVPDTEADRARAFNQMVACSGRYRLEPPDRFVIDVDVAWFEPWIGSQQVRAYRIDGDRMDIVSSPTRLPRPDGTETTVIATLTWRREAPS